jgi:hypothetical protein
MIALDGFMPIGIMRHTTQTAQRIEFTPRNADAVQGVFLISNKEVCMGCGSQNAGKRSITRIVITSPDTKDCVSLDLSSKYNDKYKDVFIASDTEDGGCQVDIPFNYVDVLIDNLKRAADKAKTFLNR